jgi:ATP-binding cassette, subfamily B, bacterial PglK
MIKVIRDLFNLLTQRQRNHFYALQVLVIFCSIVEISCVGLIINFMSLVGDINQLQQDGILAQLYRASGASSGMQFLFYTGISVCILLFFSSIISIITIWRLAMFAQRTGTEIADRLYSHYLKQNWLFHSSGNSAILTKKIAVECSRVTGGIILPLMNMNAKVALATLLSLSIFIYDPIVASIGISVFGIFYFFTFAGVRNLLSKNGEVISEVSEKRFTLMNEGFGGIKDVLLLGRDRDFINHFNHTGKKLAYSQGMNTAITATPRYFVELIAFTSMISLILYLIIRHDGNVGVVLPVLSLYAVGSVKLLPAFQQIYAEVASLKSNIPAFYSIQKDLQNSFKKDTALSKLDETNLEFKRNISLENITFNYPGIDKPTLKKLNMSIPVNSVIGIVGPSGAGKSTLIDILLGLIEPQKGHLKVDGHIIDDKNRRSWQNSFGFVAQNIFLSDGTIAENIAFGIPIDKIDFDRVNKAVELAHLNEYVKSLKEGVHTKVGERGIQISGGQRQRVGIARALYDEAQVLVLDEATSSLDGITEKMIMEAINEFSGKKTIVLIAHRLKTVQKCDKIFFIDNGEVVDQGTHEELIKTNAKFKRMADHA